MAGTRRYKKYTFKVAKDASKIEIAKAVEELFEREGRQGQHHARARPDASRMGRTQGYTPTWKKAIVTLTEDSKSIEFFEGMIVIRTCEIDAV